MGACSECTPTFATEAPWSANSIPSSEAAQFPAAETSSTRSPSRAFDSVEAKASPCLGQRRAVSPIRLLRPGKRSLWRGSPTLAPANRSTRFDWQEKRLIEDRARIPAMPYPYGATPGAARTGSRSAHASIIDFFRRVLRDTGSCGRPARPGSISEPTAPEGTRKERRS